MLNHRRMPSCKLRFNFLVYGNCKCTFSSYHAFEIVVLYCCTVRIEMCRIEINCNRCCCMRIHRYRELFRTCLLSTPWPRLESILAASRLVNQRLSKVPRSVHVLSSSSPKPLTAEDFLIKFLMIISFEENIKKWLHFKSQTKHLNRHRVNWKGGNNLKDTNSLAH